MDTATARYTHLTRPITRVLQLLSHHPHTTLVYTDILLALDTHNSPSPSLSHSLTRSHHAIIFRLERIRRGTLLPCQHCHPTASARVTRIIHLVSQETLPFGTTSVIQRRLKLGRCIRSTITFDRQVTEPNRNSRRRRWRWRWNRLFQQQRVCN